MALKGLKALFHGRIGKLRSRSGGKESVSENPTSQAVAQRSPCQRTCAAHKSRDRLPPRKKAGGLVLLVFVAVDSTSGPAPVRNERQGAKLCAIETILRRIRNGTKPAV